MASSRPSCPQDLGDRPARAISAPGQRARGAQHSEGLLSVLALQAPRHRLQSPAQQREHRLRLPDKNDHVRWQRIQSHARPLHGGWCS